MMIDYAGYEAPAVAEADVTYELYGWDPVEGGWGHILTGCESEAAAIAEAEEYGWKPEEIEVRVTVDDGDRGFVLA